MEKILEKLWNEYLSDECAVLCTDEERMLAKKALGLHEKASVMLNRSQEEAVEKYLDAICDIDALFVKKAFLKGCEFTFSFLLETGLWRVNG